MPVRIFLLIVLLFRFGNSDAQIRSFFVPLHTLDTNYIVAQDSNFVAIDTNATTNDKLLVFLDGTGSSTRYYQLFPELAAKLGYHAISIGYPNTPSVEASCGLSSDSLCFDDLRQEICYGSPVSSHVTIDTFNSIYTRIVKLLQYLDVEYPTEGWGQFLSGGVPVWNKIVVSGHSQGSGHALYFGKTQSCNRVIMFSGADDYSNYYHKPAHWIYSSFQTPLSKIFSFLHLNDDVISYSKQYAIIQALGMTVTDDSTDVDGQLPPYGNSHCLYTNATPEHSAIYSSYHDAPVVDFYTPKDGTTGNPIFDTVWNYLLTAPTTGIHAVTNTFGNIAVYPNPARQKVYISLPETMVHGKAELLNIAGSVLRYAYITNARFTMDVSQYPAGIYFIRINDVAVRFVKE